MKQSRTKQCADFKAKVALEAIKETETLRNPSATSI